MSRPGRRFGARGLKGRAPRATLAAAAAAVCLGAALLPWAAWSPLRVAVDARAGLLAVGLVFLCLVPQRGDQPLALSRGRLRRGRYDSEQALTVLRRGLTAARTVDAVIEHTRQVLSATVRPSSIVFLQFEAKGRRAPSRALAATRAAWAPSSSAAREIECGEILPRRVWEARTGASLAPRVAADADLVIPIGTEGHPVGVLALGAKLSRRASYDGQDIAFLRTAASLINLAMINAAAFDQLEALNQNLERLNEGLEQQVEERTAALHSSNLELNDSLAKLQQAYCQLERTHAGLLRADRLATVGRLTAGLAHEINTPLSAVLNSLKIIKDLSEEYRASVDDPKVLPEDHGEIAGEILFHTRSATAWANKAAGYIRSVKAHGREARPGSSQRFLLRDVVADARALVAHRLRANSCTIDYVEERSIALEGEPGRFGQVLVNLITNAIDAYEERGIADGRIEIEARHDNAGVLVRVQDWAGGIPDAVLPRIFDELYTTKGPGRGTGLGLWISRNLVEQGFGGTLDVITNREGSCFVAEFPPAEADGEGVEAPRPATGDLAGAVGAA
jgi:signal transduction histidine kinase